MYFRLEVIARFVPTAAELRGITIEIKLLNRANRAQLLLIIGTGIFAVGALGFIAGYMSH